MPSFHLSSCVHRYHIYKDVWAASVGAVLQCELEAGNSEDPYVVAVQRDGLTVGHVPHTISCMCSVFVWQSGSIVCMITRKRNHSGDLLQGGLELPCTYTFSGPEDTIKKIKQHLIEEGKSVNEVQGTGVYGLKVILDCLLSHPEQRDVCLLHTYTVIAFCVCIALSNFRVYIFANICEFTKFAKIMPRKKLYAYGIYKNVNTMDT